MASKISKIFQVIRDVLLLLSSAILVLTTYNMRFEEPVVYLLFAILAFISLLTIVNLLLIIIDVKSRVYFYINSILQLVISLFLIGLGSTAPLGIFLVVINIIILITLKKKKVVK